MERGETRIWVTTWQDTPGVRHQAIAGPADSGDMYLCDVFTPCMGYIKDALNNTRMDGAVTCLMCLTSEFLDRAEHMNLDAIEHLGESDLLDDFIDKDAMALGFDPNA
jgi:hypothetical protein